MCYFSFLTKTTLGPSLSLSITWATADQIQAFLALTDPIDPSAGECLDGIVDGKIGRFNRAYAKQDFNFSFTLMRPTCLLPISILHL